ncbi:MAG: Fe-S protein assembly co-chaperone HscB [Pseudomonadota bacterium]
MVTGCIFILFLAMNPDFTKTHFALFGLTQSFAMDVAALDNAYRDVQREVHPDRFANAPDVEKRLAAQWATQANEAYRTLKSPLNRGRYLLRINGIDTEEERNTAMPLKFLTQQMEWREAVVDAKARHDATTLGALAKQKYTEEKSLFVLLAAQLAETKTMVEARETVRKLRFLEKLGEEIDLANESIEH